MYTPWLIYYTTFGLQELEDSHWSLVQTLEILIRLKVDGCQLLNTENEVQKMTDQMRRDITYIHSLYLKFENAWMNSVFGKDLWKLSNIHEAWEVWISVKLQKTLFTSIFTCILKAKTFYINPNLVSKITILQHLH